MHPWHVQAILTPDCSRLEAFQAQGVSLKHSWRSWSGVRSVDGVVVFAIMEGEVQADDEGSRCLLWSGESRARFGLRESEERLAHCRLAEWRGGAEGILVRWDALVQSPETIELRVERIAGQYWALWGCAAQGRRLREAAPDMRSAHCCGATGRPRLPKDLWRSGRPWLQTRWRPQAGSPRLGLDLQ